MPAASATPRAREVAFGEMPTRDLHGGLTADFQRLALEAAGPQVEALDIGCGEGRVAFLLAPRVKRVTGLDRDVRSIEAGKQHARALGHRNVEFHVADVEKEPLARWAPGGVELLVAHLFLSKAMVHRAHDALRAGGRFVFTCFGPRQWQEAGGSSFAHREEEVRGWLDEAHLKTQFLGVEDTRVRFRQLTDVREYLGEERVAEWLKDGRWERLVDTVAKDKALTESRITCAATR